MRTQLGTIAVPVGGTPAIPLSLPRTHFLKYLSVRVTVNVTNAAPVAVREDGLASSLFFRLWFDNDPALEARGDNFRQYLDVYRAVLGDYTEVPGGAGAQVGTWNFVIPMSDGRLFTAPDATMVDLRLGNNPRLEVQFLGRGQISNDVNMVVNAVTVVVAAELATIAPDMPALRYLPLRKFRERTISTLAAASMDQRTQLDYGRFVRRYCFITRDRSASPVRLNTLVSDIEIAPNLWNAGRMNFTDLRAETRERYQIAPPTGVAFAEFDPGSSLSAATMLDLRGARDHEARVSTNALANGLDFVVLEESIVEPDPAAVEIVRRYLSGGR